MGFEVMKAGFSDEVIHFQMEKPDKCVKQWQQVY